MEQDKTWLARVQGNSSSTLQGEGAQGPASGGRVSSRFSGCNLLVGPPRGSGHGEMPSSATRISSARMPGFSPRLRNWRKPSPHLSCARSPSLRRAQALPIVFTGGEPAFAAHPRALSIACTPSGSSLAWEGNGTLPLPEGLDWIYGQPQGFQPAVPRLRPRAETCSLPHAKGVRPRISRIWISGISCPALPACDTRATRPTPASASPTVSCIPLSSSVCRPTKWALVVR